MNFTSTPTLSRESAHSTSSASFSAISSAGEGVSRAVVLKSKTARSSNLLKANTHKSFENLQEFSKNTEDLINGISELIKRISLEWETNPCKIDRGKRCILLSNRTLQVIAESALHRLKLIDSSNLIALQAIQDFIDIAAYRRQLEFENQSQMLTLFQSRSLLSIASDFNLTLDTRLYSAIEHSENSGLKIPSVAPLLDTTTLLDSNVRSNTYSLFTFSPASSSSVTTNDANKTHVLETLDECNEALRLVDKALYQINNHCSTFQEEIENLIVHNLNESDIVLKIETLCHEFFDGVEFLLRNLLENTDRALSLKNRAFNETAKHYSNTIQMLEQFWVAYTAIVPSYNIEVEQEKQELLHGQKKIIQQIKNLISSGDLRQGLEQKINTTLENIRKHKNLSLETLKKNLPQSEEACEMIREGNKFFAEGMLCFLCLASETINCLTTTTGISIQLLLKEQDNQMVLLAKKTDRTIQFLDYETKIIIELAEATQKPLISIEIGKNIGTAFDDIADIFHGRISKINIRAGWWLDGLQCEYQDKMKKKHVGPFHGGKGGHQRTIHLSPKEKVTKIRVGYGAWQHLNERSGIEEITFFVENSHGRGHHTYGPFGRSGCPDALEDLRKVYGNKALPSALKIKEVAFGSDYYLGAIKGTESEYISSLTFYFFRDYSSILKRDLSERLSETIAFLKTL